MLVRLNDEFAVAQKNGDYAQVRNTLKTILQNLRAVLDYVAHDIEESTRPPNLSVPNDLHFPFVHPIDRKTGAVISAQAIDAQFCIKLAAKYPGMQTAKPTVYAALRQIQGAPWLSEFIKVVNEIKHNARPELGRREIRYAENVIVRGGYIRMQVGPIFNGEVIKEETVIDPQGKVSEEFCARHGITIWEAVEPAAFKNDWIARVTLWNDETKKLVESIYELL